MARAIHYSTQLHLQGKSLKYLIASLNRSGTALSPSFDSDWRTGKQGIFMNMRAIVLLATKRAAMASDNSSGEHSGLSAACRQNARQRRFTRMIYCTRFSPASWGGVTNNVWFVDGTKFGLFVFRLVFSFLFLLTCLHSQHICPTSPVPLYCNVPFNTALLSTTRN